MSVKFKKAGRIGARIIAAFLFVCIVMFNVQIGMHDGESGDISLLDLKLNLFAPNALACEYEGGSIPCWSQIRWASFWNYSVYCPTCSGRIGTGIGTEGSCNPN
jgi:hypothetical protein